MNKPRHNWESIDWTQHDATIAKLLGCPVPTVWRARARLGKDKPPRAKGAGRPRKQFVSTGYCQPCGGTGARNAGIDGNTDDCPHCKASQPRAKGAGRPRKDAALVIQEQEIGRQVKIYAGDLLDPDNPVISFQETTFKNDGPDSIPCAMEDIEIMSAPIRETVGKLPREERWIIDEENNRIIGNDEQKTIICTFGGSLVNPEIMADARKIIAAQNVEHPQFVSQYSEITRRADSILLHSILDAHESANTTKAQLIQELRNEIP